jgi:hypothetical protein
MEKNDIKIMVDVFKNFADGYIAALNGVMAKYDEEQKRKEMPDPSPLKAI